MATTIYKENQRYQRIGLIAFIAVFTVALIVAFISQVFINQVENPIPNYVAVLTICTLLVSLVYFLSIRMVTEINEKNIRFQFYPLHATKQKIRLKDVTSYSVVNSPEGAQYSGWGVNFGAKERRFSVSGRTGLKVTTQDGERIFIGTQNPEALGQAIEQVRS